ncbi:hypothetical protein FJZ26_05545, partial [Candidatus Parvarchaeota archaeon]|nr:hypothetical protein [Candidatus Parvarchaeota archaeon]
MKEKLEGVNKHKKGVIFTIIAVILLSFMLISVTLWSNVVKEREAKTPEKLQSDSMRQIMGQLTEEKLGDFARMSARYSLARLAQFSVTHPISPAGADGISTINQSIYELMLYGGTNAGAFVDRLEYTTPEEKQYIISNWSEKVGKAAGKMGFVFSLGNVTNFSLAQADPWTVNLSFKTSVYVKNKEGTMMISRNLTVATNFSILGMEDPQASRFMGPNIKKIVFASPNENSRSYSDAQVKLVRNGKRGFGWASGYLVEDPLEATDPDKTYVWLTDYPGDEAFLGNITNISGAILKNLSETAFEHVVGGCNYTIHRDANCIICLEWATLNSGDPSLCKIDFVVGYPNTPLPRAYKTVTTDVPFVARTGGLGSAASLGQVAIVNTNSDPTDIDEDKHLVFDITGPRQMLECGYYVSSQGNAPSYLQRLLAQSYDRKSA